MNLLAPAKINLCLRIRCKRNDGYHEICTLMQRISIFDEVDIELTEKGIELIPEGGEVPHGLDNLAGRAAQIFFQAAGLDKGVRIRLRKKIPIAAGLGGGSSDAASVLWGLNAILKMKWSKEFLQTLGVKLGADVPFFIGQKSALAKGIGEKLIPVILPKSMWYLLFIPPWPISTSWAYAAFDELKENRKPQEEIAPEYSQIEDILPIMANDLEKVAFQKYPELAIIKNKLIGEGARGALMSGSGPAIYGLFSSRKEVVAVAQKMAVPSGWKVLIAQGLADEYN
ncbi:MAG: 4-(cytidine 5'-diphospho)-2-C-methyl-D-erythritol kinase [Thermodesulfobacteriota bacterium]